LAHQLGLEGRLNARRRQRLARAVTEDSAAWQRAAEAAKAWSVAASLRWLREAYEGGDNGSLLARLSAARERLNVQEPGAHWTFARALKRVIIRRRDPQPVIALSGLDGAGKSTQARLLADALQNAGFEVAVLWDRIIYNRSLLWLAAPLRLLLRLAPQTRRRLAEQVVIRQSEDASGTFAIPEDHRAVRGLRERLPWLNPAWITVVALLHVVPLRRKTMREIAHGRVVIRDRYVLDSLVHLQDRYGPSNVQLQMRLVARLAPPPLLAFFLDLSAPEAYRRKPEEHTPEALEDHRKLYLQEAHRLGITLVDASMPAQDLADLIAREVLRRLRD
jgi:thymidylate kinase